MAKRRHKKNSYQQKKQDNSSNLRVVMAVFVIVIVGIAAIAAFGNKKGSIANNTGTQPQSIASLQQQVQNAEKAFQANPKDRAILKNLGDAYYDLGNAYLQNNNKAEATVTYAKAIEPYQKTLEQKFDINVQTDMATAAFYGNKPEVAEEAFKTAIEKDPNFMTARLNYGIFLTQVKNDKEGAKRQYEVVANQTKDKAAAEKAKQLLSGL